MLRTILWEICGYVSTRDTPLPERQERERKGKRKERVYVRLKNEDSERDKGGRKEEARRKRSNAEGAKDAVTCGLFARV